jgi:hypothetical protein
VIASFCGRIGSRLFGVDPNSYPGSIAQPSQAVSINEKAPKSEHWLRTRTP